MTYPKRPPQAPAPSPAEEASALYSAPIQQGIRSSPTSGPYSGNPALVKECIPRATGQRWRNARRCSPKPEQGHTFLSPSFVCPTAAISALRRSQVRISYEDHPARGRTRP
jgi:hypothetical protein